MNTASVVGREGEQESGPVEVGRLAASLRYNIK